jgi:RNA polymerase sigma-70 factor (ECF subfamily)
MLPTSSAAIRRPTSAAPPARCRCESPSQALLRKERELQLADALAHLAPDHCEVIVLRNLQRLPFDEVAKRMSRSRPAAQMLWMRAIHKLQEVMAGGDLTAAGDE